MSVNLSKAKKAAEDRKQKELSKQIEAIAKGEDPTEVNWVRKSVALDKELIAAIDALGDKERKNFSQLTREALLALLKTRGIEL